MNHINELLNETLVAEITLKNDAIKNNIEQQVIKLSVLSIIMMRKIIQLLTIL